MWMPDGSNGKHITEEGPPFADAFKEINRFILNALNGNAAAANAIFQKYLAGELPDELLQISRRHVQDDQARASVSQDEGPIAPKREQQINARSVCRHVGGGRRANPQSPA
jgi:hypothetical protein